MESTKVIEETTDPLLRHLENYSSAPGQSRMNVFRQTSQPSIPRDWVSGCEQAMAIMTVKENCIQCTGAALGLGTDGLARHIRPNIPLQGFLGFCLSQREPDRVPIKTRGRLQIRLPGVTLYSIGKQVFCSDVHDFNLEGIGWECGIVSVLQPDRKDTCQIMFKSFLDPKPFPEVVSSIH